MSGDDERADLRVDSQSIPRTACAVRPHSQSCAGRADFQPPPDLSRSDGASQRREHVRSLMRQGTGARGFGGEAHAHAPARKKEMSELLTRGEEESEGGWRRKGHANQTATRTSHCSLGLPRDFNITAGAGALQHWLSLLRPTLHPLQSALPTLPTARALDSCCRRAASAEDYQYPLEDLEKVAEVVRVHWRWCRHRRWCP